jgi:hypothetical protein
LASYPELNRKADNDDDDDNVLVCLSPCVCEITDGEVNDETDDKSDGETETEEDEECILSQ